MKVTDDTRRALEIRRERRQLEALGYRMHETDWEIMRGGRTREVILDAKIDPAGRHVWTLLGPPESEGEQRG